ncbi:hypothetical protein CcaCcLH18_10121 [Colletotrichum camelliae]|nr:hypothetical protein CcaCcLH18_10121 [Colletotrichum camelliae]
MTRLTTHLQGDCLAKPFDLESRIRRFLSDITDTAIRHDHLYRDLRELEQAAAEHTARVASCELRSSLRPEATTILLCILPKDRFTVRDDTIPKLEKAASIWAVDKLLILFCISFDHCQQGRAFFTELLHLAEVNNHWPACIKALNRAARDRRAGYKVYNPSTRATRGIALDDIHKSKQFLVSSKIALSKPASVPNAIDYYPNGDNRGAAAEVSELSHHDASHANSSKRGQSVKEDSSSNPAESRSQPKSIEQGVTAETIVSEQENSADTLGEDESVELPRGSEQDTDAFDPAGQSVELASSDISSLFGDENPPNDSEASDPLATDSYRYFDFDSENQPDNFLDFGDNAAATHGFEEKDIAQDCNPAPSDTPHPPFPSKIMAAPPSPKRQRRSRNHPPILEQEATAILQHGHPIEQGLVNRALADICDSQGADICFVDSTQLDDMGRDDYQACPDLAHGPRGVLNCRSVIVPVKISDGHIVCGVIRQRRLAATMVGYYKSSGEPWETTPRVHDATAKFIKVYLPATANRRRPPTPFDGPRESNIEDSGVVSFAMAIMYISHVPVIKLHMGIWRRVLAVCLGHEVTD